MTKIKQYFKSKDFIAIFLLICTFSTINIYTFIKNTYLGNGLFIDGVNCFSFWNYVLHYNLGSILMFLSPFLICLSSLNILYHEFTGSIFKNELMREKYGKVLIKKITFSYFKAWIPFTINSVIVFILGLIMFEKNIPNTIYANQYINFSYNGVSNPYLFFLLSNVSLLLYVILIVNICIIIIKISKKRLVSYVITFVFINALNFVIGNFSILIAKIIGNPVLLNYAYNINIYEGYFVQSTILRAIIHTSILDLITIFVLFILYKNKEKVVLDFE